MHLLCPAVLTLSESQSTLLIIKNLGSKPEGRLHSSISVEFWRTKNGGVAIDKFWELSLEGFSGRRGSLSLSSVIRNTQQKCNLHSWRRRRVQPDGSRNWDLRSSQSSWEEVLYYHQHIVLSRENLLGDKHVSEAKLRAEHTKDAVNPFEI